MKKSLIAFAALALSLPSTLAEDAVVRPNGNLADMDGTVNPARVEGQVINGTAAHILVQLASDGTYTLKSPDGLIAGTTTSQNHEVIFLSVSLTKTGWWKLEDALGNAVTSFQVVAYSGSFDGVQSYQVYTTDGVPGGEIGPFHLQDLYFNSGNSPKCFTSGLNQANQARCAQAGALLEIVCKLDTYAPNVNAGDTAVFRWNRLPSTFAGNLILPLHVDTLKPDVLSRPDPFTIEADTLVIFGANGGSAFDHLRGWCKDALVGGTSVYTDPFELHLVVAPT
jgi:hypothetical protein